MFITLTTMLKIPDYTSQEVEKQIKVVKMENKF